MKIYYQYALSKTLAPTKGDYVNEIGILTALSKFAEVFYSGRRFDPSGVPYGMVDYPGEIHHNVPQDCDLYYVRANRKAFYKAPPGKAKVWMASPFDAECYRDATAVAAFTQAWADGLTRGDSYRWMPPEECKPRTNVVNIDQVVGDTFRPLRKSHKAKEIRASLGGDFVIGHFGRVVKSNYPHALFDTWKTLHATFPNTRMLFGLTKGATPALPGMVSRKFHYKDVPYAISACDIIVLSNWGPEWEICGCGKALEAAACGVPVVLGRAKARFELFGEDYPFFVPGLSGPSHRADSRRMTKLLSRIINNRELLLPEGEKLRQKAEFFSADQAAIRLQKLFDRICK